MGKKKSLKGPAGGGAAAKNPLLEALARQKREADLKQAVQESLALQKQADESAQHLVALQGAAGVSAESGQPQSSLQQGDVDMQKEACATTQTATILDVESPAAKKSKVVLHSGVPKDREPHPNATVVYPMHTAGNVHTVLAPRLQASLHGADAKASAKDLASLEVALKRAAWYGTRDNPKQAPKIPKTDKGEQWTHTYMTSWQDDYPWVRCNQITVTHPTEFTMISHPETSEIQSVPLQVCI